MHRKKQIVYLIAVACLAVIALYAVKRTKRDRERRSAPVSDNRPTLMLYCSAWPVSFAA